MLTSFLNVSISYVLLLDFVCAHRLYHTHAAPSFLPDPNTLYTKVPTNEPGRFLSSSLATPFPDSPRSNSSSGANNKFKSRSLGSLDQNLSTTSPNRTLEPFFHSTAPLSAEVTHTPTRACIPPRFNARNIASHPASPHFTPTSSSTASSGDFPASNTTPVSSTPPLHIPAFNTSAARPPFQSSPSSSTSSTQTVIMHSPNPTRSPNSALTQARALSLSCILSHAQPNGEEHVDCEGLCAHSRERQENPDQLMDSPERQCQSMDPESQDQNQRIDSEEQRIDEETGNPGQDTDLDMSAGEFNSLPAETNANADVTVNTRGSAPVLETALEVGSMPVDPPPTLGTPFSPRTSSNVLDDVAPRELEDVETYVPGPVRTREVSDTNEDERGVDPDESMHVDHASNSPVREPESEREDVRERIMEEELRIESEGGHLPVDGSRGDFVKPAEERFAPAFAPSMGNPSQQTVGNESGSQGHSSECPQELYTDPGDNTQPENILPDSRPAPSNLPDPGNNVHSENILSEPRQSTPLDLPRSDADHVEQYKSECGDLDGSLEESVKPAEEYPALAFEQNTALQSQQTFENQYQGRSSEYPGDSVQPENVFSEKLHQPTPSDLPRSDADRLEQHQFEGSDLGRSLKESVQLAKERSAPAFAPDTGVPNQQTFESQSQGRPSQHQNVLSKSCHPTPSDLPRSDADYLGEHEPLHVEDPREPTPADSLLQDEEDVAAVLTAVPLSPEGQCTPSPFSPKPAFLPPQSEPETQNGHGCSGMRDLGDGIASRDLKEEFSRDDDDFDASSLIFSDTDGATSDHREHVESDIRASEISAQPEEVNLGRTISVTTPPPLLPSFQLSSLSPLSSLAGSPPRLEDENDERRNETKIELRRTGSLDSDMEFGAYRIRSGSSVSALQKKKKAVDPRKSSASLVPRGGHSASMEELSLLARKNPSKPTINLSGLKRKLGSTSQSTIQQPEKKIRFNKDGDGDRAMIATSLSMDDADSSFAGSIRGPDMSDPMHQSSRPPTTMQDVTAFEVGRVSALMKVDSASVIASGTTAEMKRTGTPSNELLVGSTQLPKKRFRQISQKARESTGSTQKVRQPRKDASGMPNKRAPQKRKSKSTSVQDEALVCQWPERSDLDGSVARQFVQCDKSVSCCRFVLLSFLSFWFYLAVTCGITLGVSVSLRKILVWNRMLALSVRHAGTCSIDLIRASWVQ